jgi:hypothetical protein
MYFLFFFIFPLFNVTVYEKKGIYEKGYMKKSAVLKNEIHIKLWGLLLILLRKVGELGRIIKNVIIVIVITIPKTN